MTNRRNRVRLMHSFLIAFLVLSWSAQIGMFSQDQPILEVSPETFTLEVNADERPDPVTLTISNTGEGEMEWETADNADWLIAESSGVLAGGQSTEFDVIALVENLEAGTHQATITVTAQEAESSPVEVPVTLTLEAAGTGKLSVNPTQLSFQPPNDENRPTQSVAVANTGDAALDWTAATDAAWIRLSPSQGTLAAGDKAAMEVTALTGDLSAGNHQATITVRSPNAQNSPIRIQASVAITKRFSTKTTVTGGETTLLEFDKAFPDVWEFVAQDRKSEPIQTSLVCVLGSCELEASGGIENVEFRLAEPGTKAEGKESTGLPDGLKLANIGVLFGIPQPPVLADSETFQPLIRAVDTESDTVIAEVWIVLTVTSPDE